MKTIYLFMTLFFISCTSNTNSGYQDPREKQKLLVYDQVIREVSASLKSPSTANFPLPKDRIYHVFHVSGYKYSVSSWVDSQNSYGAMIRTKFIMDAVINGNSVTCSNMFFLDGLN